ncbi:MAG: SDR family NAD(P)-dependent oxidoreductase, partial [Kiritimatiellaeota bacterium]|nr:SDR family NAD(P)-dependent oxidoreductase [Kiritimatiellota bacterium]
MSEKTSSRLGGKTVIVTGAAQGFGEGIARELADNGARLVIADLNETLARAVADSIGGGAVAVKVDVTNEESVRNLIDETVRIFGGVDLLVSNAGVLRAGGLDEMTLADFEFVTKVRRTR